jgi:DNA-binding transcriptional LysR family regulator
LIRSVFREADVEPTVIMSVREMSTLLSLVREGLGVTLVPALALPPTLPSGLTTAGLRPAALRRLVIAAPSVTIGPVLSAFLTSAGLPRLSTRR